MGTNTAVTVLKLLMENIRDNYGQGNIPAGTGEIYIDILTAQTSNTKAAVQKQ